MTLAERLNEDMKAAMKAREAGKRRLSALRMVRAAIKNKEIEVGHPLNDEGIIEVLAKEIRQRREVLPDYLRSGRAELVAALEEEIRILEEYLPPPLDAEELAGIIREAVRETGARGLGDIGKVMSAVMPVVRGRADGREVNRLVREVLGTLN